MDPILFIATYYYIIGPAIALIGVLIGKMLEGRTTRKELDEANAALIETVMRIAPGWDLGYNMATGRIPMDEANLKKLAEACSGSWTDMKKLSKEVKDVLESLEPPKVA